MSKLSARNRSFPRYAERNEIPREAVVPRLLVGCALAVGLGSAACSGDANDELPAFELDRSGTESLAARLEADTGTAWYVSAPNVATHARMLAPFGKAIPSPGNALEKGATFFSRYGAALGANQPFDEAVVEEESSFDDGSTNVKYRHMIPGTQLPVFEVGSSLQLNADGSVAFVESAFGLDFGTVRSATIDSESAKERANAYVRKKCGSFPLTASLSLGGFPDQLGRVRLAYRVDLGSTDRCNDPLVYVDASSGDIIQFQNESRDIFDPQHGGGYYYWADATDTKSLDVTQVGNAQYELRTTGPGARVLTHSFDPRFPGNFDPNPIRASSLGRWESLDQGITVDAHYHTTRALEYFRLVHGRNGLDGQGTDVHVVVHDNSAANALGDNAFYSPITNAIHFGDGARRYHPLAMGFDVVAHELSHGIIAHTSRLIYQGESGALDESFADAMSMAAKMWAPETRTGANFGMGGRAMRNRPFARNMLNPEADGVSISNYAKIAPCTSPDSTNDYCGVHTLSGIPNRAYAIMTVGGQETTSYGQIVAVPEGIGFEASRYIWFQAMTTLANPRTTFREAAVAQIKVAQRLGPKAHAAVGCAWGAVGVFSPAELLLWAPTCRTAQPVPRQTSCAFVDFGYVCDDQSPFSATLCVGRSINSSIQCKNPLHRCIQASPGDFGATVDAFGALNCK